MQHEYDKGPKDHVQGERINDNRVGSLSQPIVSNIISIFGNTRIKGTRVYKFPIRFPFLKAKPDSWQIPHIYRHNILDQQAK